MTPEAQVRSAVTHLESAKAAAIAKLQKRRLLRNLTRSRQVIIDGNRLRYINGLLAICYRYLGEEPLAKECLALTKRLYGTDQPWTSAEHWTQALGWIVEMFTAIEEDFINENKYKVDWDAFELPPRGVLPEAPPSSG